MSFIVEDKGANFERCPAGVHLARCYRVVDLGTQRSEYMGEAKFTRKVMIGWEVHGTDDNGQPIRMSDGRPFAIFKNYTLSWSEKANLRLDLQSWRGREFSAEEMRKFDLKNILGAWCMLNVINRDKEGKTYTNVNGITPVPAIVKQGGFPQPVNKNELFYLAEPDMEMFETFSDNLKKKIQSSPEWQKILQKSKSDYDDSGVPTAQDDDPIPF